MAIKFFSILQAWKFAFISYISHLYIFVFTGLIALVLLLFYTFFTIGFVAGTEYLDYFVTHKPDVYTFFMPLVDIIIERPLQAMLSVLLGIIIIGVYDMGLMSLALQIYDNQKISIATILQPRVAAIKYIIALCACYIMIAFGIVLFIIPGVIWYARYYFMGYFIIDNHVGTKKNICITWRVCVRIILFSFVNSVIFVCLLYVNTYVAFLCGMPLIALARVYAYRELLKESLMPMPLGVLIHN